MHAAAHLPARKVRCCVCQHCIGRRHGENGRQWAAVFWFRQHGGGPHLSPTWPKPHRPAGSPHQGLTTATHAPHHDQLIVVLTQGQLSPRKYGQLSRPHQQGGGSPPVMASPKARAVVMPQLPVVATLLLSSRTLAAAAGRMKQGDSALKWAQSSRLSRQASKNHGTAVSKLQLAGHI